jgi:hypothetical protein
MSSDLFGFSAPIFARHLRILGDLITTAERHASDHKIDPAALISARLYPDMFSLAGQVRAACGTAERTVARLLGRQAPDSAGDDETFSAMHERIGRVVAEMARVTERDFAGADQRTVDLPAGGSTLTLTAREYLLRFSLPNFYFHVTTAYDILRHNGVALGKRDFLQLSSAT